MPFFRRILLPALLGLLVLAVPSSASAMSKIPGCEGDPAPVVESADDGIQGFFDAPEGWVARDTVVSESSDGTTQYETLSRDYWQELGISGLTWHTIRESCVDHMTDAPISGVANLLWMVAKIVSLVSITLYEWAMSGDALHGLEDLVVAGVLGLRRAIWEPFLGAVVVLGAVWLGWWGLIRQRATMSVEGAVWMVGAVVLGIWVTGSPSSMLDTAGRVTMWGADVAHLALTPVSASTDSQPGCPADRSENAFALDLGEDGEDISGREQMAHQHAELLWSGLLCRPWAAGVFGNGAAGKDVEADLGSSVLAAQSVSRSTTHDIAAGRYSVEEVYPAKEERYTLLAENLKENHPDVYPLFAGDRPWDRLGVAAMALIASLCAGGLLFIVALSALVAQMGFMLLLLLAPVFLAAGVHPGKGRILLTRWVETALGILLRHVLLVLLLMLLVEVYVAILGWDMGWGGQMLVLTLATLALLVYRRRLTEIVTSVVHGTEPRRVGAAMAGAAGAAGAMGAVGGRGGAGAPGRDGANTGSGQRQRSGRWGRSGAPSRRSSAAGSTATGRRASGGGTRKAESAPQAEPEGGTERGQQQRGQDGRNSSAGESSGTGNGSARESGSGDPGGSGRRKAPEHAPRLRGRGDPSPPVERDPSPRKDGDDRSGWGGFSGWGGRRGR